MKHLKILLIFALYSCASVPNVLVCRQQAISSGFCTYTIDDKDIMIDDTHLYKNKTWIDLKLEMVLVPVESWVEIKSYILKKCKKNQDCNAQIGTWSRKIDSVNP